MTTFKKKQRNPYYLFFRLIDPDSIFSSLERSLISIGTAIKTCADYINEASSEDENYGDIITDEETEIIESLLGTSFVLCQTYITCIVSRVKSLHKLLKQREKKPISRLTDRKWDIMKLGAEQLGEHGYSDIQIIDAFANYFKHHEEWPTDWSEVNDKHKRTVAVIQACGAQSGSTGNLRTGSEVLGNREFERVYIFARRLKAWGAKVKQEYETRLKEECVF